LRCDVQNATITSSCVDKTSLQFQI